MGAWIETIYGNNRSFRGEVAPFMGAWIETSSPVLSSAYQGVAPFMGAWIETVWESPDLG